MKTVFNNSDLAHVWAAQKQSEGKAGSFYFRGCTIYSYGSHFPIATMEGDNVFFTKRTYSSTTAKHIGLTRSAISHKNLIYCYDVPVNLKYASTEHENNLNRWKREIKSLFSELGNKKIRNTQSRVNGINNLISELNTYCQYFKHPVKDKELKKLLKLTAMPDFLEQAMAAKDKENAANEKKMKQAVKAHEQYINLWREYKEDAIKELPSKTKELNNFYANHSESYTRLRFNAAENRVETSKGVQIPAEIAKRAFIQLNGCMEGICKSVSVPVLNYTITETTKDSIKAGCHTIPKSDIWYIANLLKWSK
jgi:hypothetical protein